jgi:beta-lactamase class A
MMNRGLLPVVVLALGLARAAAAQAPPVPRPADILRRQFDARLQAIAERVDGVASYTIVDLTTGDRFTRYPDVVLPTASTIKLAVLYELFRQSDDGRLKLQAALPLDRRLAVAGGPGLFYLGTPTLSLREYATMMVMLSDNTATNVLIRTLGMEAVNSRTRGLGLQHPPAPADADLTRPGAATKTSTGRRDRAPPGDVLQGEGLKPEPG